MEAALINFLVDVNRPTTPSQFMEFGLIGVYEILSLGTIHAISVSFDGRVVVCGGQSKEVLVIDTEARVESSSLWDQCCIFALRLTH